jgi:hypothetical protein
MRRTIALKGAGLAALLLGLGAALPAQADLRVIESNVKQYAVGTVVPNDTVFKLESGDRVQVLVLPGNSTRVFEGKGSHTVAEPRGGSRSVTMKKKPAE